MATTLYDFIVKDLHHQDVDFSQFKGKVLLIVNTASHCGFTPQYKGLESLYQKYKDKGLVVIGFPCNQFGSQEPGTSEEIESFCELNFGVSFPLMEKIQVNGKETAPIYTFLKKRDKGFLFSRIKWNFTKFLVSADGETIKRFSPTTKPESLENEIITMLSGLNQNF